MRVFSYQTWETWVFRAFVSGFILGWGGKSCISWHFSSVPQGSSSSFVFGSGPSAPAAGPAFGTSQAPAFGQSQGSSQPSAPSFGSLSTPLFSAGAQPAPPAFGSVTSSTQPSLFGQQATQQPGFGSGAPSTGECQPASSLLVSQIIFLFDFFMKCTFSYMEKDDLLPCIHI